MAKSEPRVSKERSESGAPAMHPFAETDPSASAPAGRECELFLQALEQPTPAAQKAFLEKACANDPALRATLQELLAHHTDDQFLETPAVGAGLLHNARPSDLGLGGLKEKAGDRIGAYKLF